MPFSSFRFSQELYHAAKNYYNDNSIVSTYGPISGWTFGIGVRSMAGLFAGQESFNEDISNWDVIHVNHMDYMFAGCKMFNKPLNKWKVNNVETMEHMFHGCVSFNQPLNKWTVSLVTNMSFMFCGCVSFNQPLNKWKPLRVTNMSYMFVDCKSFNQPLDKWKPLRVNNMSYMFAGCESFNQSLNQWGISIVTNMEGMFYNCKTFNQPLNNLIVDKVDNMKEMFYGCVKFNQNLNTWDVSKVTNMSYMFCGCESFNQPLNDWNVSIVTNMGGMFYGCKEFNQPLNKWNVSKVKKMVGIFFLCPIEARNAIWYKLIFELNLRESCFDIVTGSDVVIQTFLDENPNHMVFCIMTLNEDKQYIPINRSIKVGVDKSKLYDYENPRAPFEFNTIYRCLNAGSMRADNIVTKIPLYNIKAVVGFGDVVGLNIIENIFRDNVRIICLLETPLRFASTVSAQNLGPNPDYVSSRHCQEGQGATLYDAVTPLTYVEGEATDSTGSSDVIETASSPTTLTVLVSGTPHVLDGIIAGTTIGDVKSKLYVKLGKTPETLRIRLVYRGQILNDTDIVSEKVTPGDVINAFVSAIGGGNKTKRGRRHKKQKTKRKPKKMKVHKEITKKKQ